jgi:hypothetical protein
VKRISKANDPLLPKELGTVERNIAVEELAVFLNL